MEYCLIFSNIVLIAVVCVMLVRQEFKAKGLVTAIGKVLGEHLDRSQTEPVHLSADGIMDVLRIGGYVPERIDEKTVDFKKEGILYRVTYAGNRMDMSLTFNLDKLSAEEEQDVRDICARVSDSIIMADAFLDEPDKSGNSTITFKISMMLRCRDEFAASYGEYIEILDELHARFIKASNENDDDSATDQPDDPAAIPVPPSSRSKLLN